MLMQRTKRRRWPAAVSAALAALAAASIAHAHGGMAGPEEIGPPLFTSFAIGFVCYWLIILWPSSKNHDDPPANQAARRARNRRGRKRPALRERGARELPSLNQSGGPMNVVKRDRIAGEGDHG